MNHKYSKAIVMIALFASFNMNAQTLTPIAPTLTSQDANQRNFKEFCGADSLHNEKMKNDPQYKERHEKMKLAIKNAASQKFVASNDILQVPVVVHVMHKGEAIGTGTNISDEDVKLGIQYLNNYWRKRANTLGFGEGVDMKIEFILAIQDDNGNTTDGINRVDMSNNIPYSTNGVNRSGNSGISDADLKALAIWTQTKYYNVWIVDEIDNSNCYVNSGSFIGGYAYGAGAHGYVLDGSVVLICSYLNESSSTFAHEMGHALNLPHTFDGDDPDNGLCGDDGIADTPPHIRTSKITPSIYWDCETTTSNNCDSAFNQVINPETGYTRSSGTHQDHMFNYMDYSGCSSEFTGGQRAVSNAALTVVRASYLTSTALTPIATAVVDFSSTATLGCIDQQVSFTDASTNTPNSYTNSGYDNISFVWTFDNGAGSTYTSSQQNPSITFENAGSYDVTLQITNLQGTSTRTKQNNVIITPSPSAVCTPTSFNNNANFGTGVTSVSFNTLSNLTNTFVPASGFVDFRCSKNTLINASTSYDLEVIYQSIDSSQHTGVWIDWDNSGTFEANERVLETNVETDNAGSHTFTTTVTPPANATLNTVLTMRVISNMNSSPVVCNQNFAGRADDYGVYVSTTLGNEAVSALQLKIYPNPVQDELTITLQNNAVISAYEIYDITGKRVMGSTQITSNRIQVSELSKGMYFMKIKAGKLEMVSKFIKK